MPLELIGLSKRYGPVEVLRPLSLVIADGEFLTLLGPSGSGKTTVLRLIGGFTDVTGGRVLHNGADVTKLPPHRRPFNTVFQDYALFPHMTVLGNVAYGPMVQGRRSGQTRKLVDETLSVVGLADLKARYPSQLSGGQRQRVALARAIVCEPKVILLDEPLAALDANLRKQMQLFLKQLQRRIRTTFVFVTHDQEEAITMSDRIVVMKDGRIEQSGTPKDVYYAPKTRFVASFFGENNLIPGRVRASDPRGTIVDTALGPLQAQAAGHAAGESVLLAVRPERLRIAPSGTDAALRARIEEKVFIGATTRLILTPLGHDDLTLDLRLPSDANMPLDHGDEVRLTYDPADAVVVAV
ncbi:MAG: ABC transporter ATP-binding protein [Parvibaculaceae bacterium]